MSDSGPVQTARLSLRRPRPGDEGDYRRIFIRPEVARWLRPAPLPPLDASTVETMLRSDLAHWEKHGYGQWAVTEREGMGVVGRGGICWTEVEGTPAIELAWTIDPDRHGEGLAGELAGAAVGFARERGIEELIAMTLPHNLASRRVAERLGMDPAGDIVHAGLPHVLYRIALT